MNIYNAKARWQETSPYDSASIIGELKEFAEFTEDVSRESGNVSMRVKADRSDWLVSALNDNYWNNPVSDSTAAPQSVTETEFDGAAIRIANMKYEDENLDALLEYEASPPDDGENIEEGRWYLNMRGDERVNELEYFLDREIEKGLMWKLSDFVDERILNSV